MIRREHLVLLIIHLPNLCYYYLRTFYHLSVNSLRQFYKRILNLDIIMYKQWKRRAEGRRTAIGFLQEQLSALEYGLRYEEAAGL